METDQRGVKESIKRAAAAAVAAPDDTIEFTEFRGCHVSQTNFHEYEQTSQKYFPSTPEIKQWRCGSGQALADLGGRGFVFLAFQWLPVAGTHHRITGFPNGGFSRYLPPENLH